MRHIRYLVSALGLVAFAALPVRAAEGRIPIWEPRVITQPGSYVVTRDIGIKINPGPILDIQADGVTVDLNGHTLIQTDPTQPGIHASGGGGGAGKVGFNVFGGRIEGGLYGILYSGSPGDDRSLSLANLTIAGSAEAAVKGVGFSKLEAQGIIIINSLVGFDLQASSPPSPIPPQATIRGVGLRAGGGIHCTGVVCSIHDVTFQYDPPSAAPATPAIRFQGVTGGEAVGIVVIGSLPAGIVPGMLDVVASSGIIIINSNVYGPGTGNGGPCVMVDAMSPDFIIDDSKLVGCGEEGIRALGSNGTIRRNMVARNGGHGIFVAGWHSLIDDNKPADNSGAGIWFETSGHIYRNNILRGNTGRGVDGPGLADSTDAGGNVE